MKVFFSASPRALKKYNVILRRIYDEIIKLGHENLSDLVITNDTNNFYKSSDSYREQHFVETINNIRNSDIVVVEASIHSLAIGYIVEKALELSKQVIVLYTGDNEPFFFSGNTNERLQLIDYRLDTIFSSLKEAFLYAENSQNIRFNIIFSNEMNNFIKRISKKQNISRSSYVRSLIYDKM